VRIVFHSSLQCVIVQRSNGSTMIRSILAIISGYLVFGISAALFFAVTGHNPHLPPHTLFFIGSVSYGVLFAVLAGYVAAFLAKKNEFRHALAVCCIIGLIAFISLVMTMGKGSIWSETAAIVFMCPAAILGGYIRAQQIQNKKNRNNQNISP
jgi:peptidoglycan/LPS O-acetylase OafA/YrhL